MATDTHVLDVYKNYQIEQVQVFKLTPMSIADQCVSKLCTEMQVMCISRLPCWKRVFKVLRQVLEAMQ